MIPCVSIRIASPFSVTSCKNITRSFYGGPGRPTATDMFVKYSTTANFIRNVVLTKYQSANVLKAKLNDNLSVMGMLFTKQCNFYAAQRVRRLSQMWQLYSKLYTERSVRSMVSRLRNAVHGRLKTHGVLLSAVAMFQWDSQRIADSELQNCINDFYQIDHLNCKMVSSSNTFTAQASSDCENDDTSAWELLVKKENIKIWRKAIPDSCLYEYKVYGSYFDISSRAFFQIQMDVDYRKKWDKLVTKLHIVDEDEDSDCQVVHWVMHFLYPMYDREYVYIRRWKVDDDKRLMVLSSRSVDHPKCPISKNLVRVDKYKSQMVVRPHKTFDENGFDYVLTYFDDPQANLPSVAYNWVATSGVTEFLSTVHNVAKNLQQERCGVKSTNKSNSGSLGSTPQMPAYA